MVRANFFFKFFKYKKKSSCEIVQYNTDKNFSIQNQINTKITEIDKKISHNSTALIEAQVVKFRSKFSRSNNLISQIGKNIYTTKLDESINWYQQQLKELYFSRRKLEIDLEKIKGIFWLNRIKRFLKITLIGFFIFFSLFIFLSGFMIIIYLMPLILLILLVYLISKKRY
tara:strand:+ start:2918 stop:3430 length:513 start_codon:yes stop_codon:yes gene_type:complete